MTVKEWLLGVVSCAIAPDDRRIKAPAAVSPMTIAFRSDENVVRIQWAPCKPRLQNVAFATLLEAYVSLTTILDGLAFKTTSLQNTSMNSREDVDGHCNGC
ncbi:hypothetical protein [Rhizobium rhizogenes]|uniref:hypothetical protein n=1 Tax=Rhizobium rhizogenes TaxID=359 RepID=UPI0022711966|nr:hypothetical protein [Rhizobium rhizogenes]